MLQEPTQTWLEQGRLSQVKTFTPHIQIQNKLLVVLRYLEGIDGTQPQAIHDHLCWPY